MKLVKMYHDKPWEQAGATEADVPKEAVESWKAHGWYLKAEKPKKAEKKAADK